MLRIWRNEHFDHTFCWALQNVWYGMSGSSLHKAPGQGDEGLREGGWCQCTGLVEHGGAAGLAGFPERRVERQLREQGYLGVECIGELLADTLASPRRTFIGICRATSPARTATSEAPACGVVTTTSSAFGSA